MIERIFRTFLQVVGAFLTLAFVATTAWSAALLHGEEGLLWYAMQAIVLVGYLGAFMWYRAGNRFALMSILVGLLMSVAELFVDAGEKDGILQAWASIGLVFCAAPVFISARRRTQLAELRAKLWDKT